MGRHTLYQTIVQIGRNKMLQNPTAVLPHPTLKARFYVLLLLLSLAIGHNTIAQEQDFGAYYSIGLEHRFNNWLEGTVTPEIRFFDNHSRVETGMLEADLKAKLNDYFSTGVYYRFAVKQPNPNELERVHRYGIYGRASYRIKPFDISYRCLYFEQFSNYNSSPQGTIADKMIRNKIMLAYSKKKYDFEPFAYAEHYQQLAPQAKSERMKLKLSAGVDYKINKSLRVSLAYLNQTQYNVKNPTALHIITTELKIKL
jgi:hypothetical protein